jgi:integrase
MRGADVHRLKREWIDLKKEEIKIYVAKLKGTFIRRPIHHKLIGYLKEFFDKHRFKPEERLIKCGHMKFTSMFNYSIRRIFPDAKNVGTHTPRHSLAAYLRNEAQWDREWIVYRIRERCHGCIRMSESRNCRG